MRVKMKTTAAGPDFTAKPGDEIEVPEEQGYDLVNGRYAEEVAGTVKFVQTEPEGPETDPGEESDYRATLSERTVAGLTTMAEGVGITVNPRTLKADLIDALTNYVFRKAEDEVETAEASQGENAAKQTSKPQPRRRSAPKK